MRRFLRFTTLSSLTMGCIFLVVTLVAGVVLFQKQRVVTNVMPGETVAVEFAGNYRIDTFKSRVKIAGVPIGTVKSIRRIDSDTTRMELKVDGESLKKMGTAPSAQIRPATMLGGNYYIDIVPGGRRGEFSGTIPADRTELPVELDSIAAALNAPARDGIRSSISDLNDSVDEDGQEAVRDLVDNAPEALEPAGTTLQSLRGSQPGKDLPDFVSGFEATSRILSEKQGQLDSTVQNLAKTTSVLSARRNETAAAIDQLPSALNATDSMLVQLDGTLKRLRDTAPEIRPAVRELTDVLDDVDPVLVKARPVVADLRTVARDARPLVNDLVPISQNLTASFDNLRGPVLDRTNGPILSALNGGWEGEGVYAGTGSDHPLYEEIGYTVANLTQANMADANGGMVSFQAGLGASSIAGLPVSPEQLLQMLQRYSTGGGAQ